MILDANLPVTSPILVTRGSTPTNGLDVREQNEANNHCSGTSGQTSTGLVTETVEHLKALWHRGAPDQFEEYRPFFPPD